MPLPSDAAKILPLAEIVRHHSWLLPRPSGHIEKHLQQLPPCHPVPNPQRQRFLPLAATNLLTIPLPLQYFHEWMHVQSRCHVLLADKYSKGCIFPDNTLNSLSKLSHAADKFLQCPALLLFSTVSVPVHHIFRQCYNNIGVLLPPTVLPYPTHQIFQNHPQKTESFLSARILP